MSVVLLEAACARGFRAKGLRSESCRSKGPKATHDAAVMAKPASPSTAVAEHGTMHPGARTTTCANVLSRRQELLSASERVCRREGFKDLKNYVLWERL